MLLLFAMLKGHAQYIEVEGGETSKRLVMKTGFGYHYNEENKNRKPIVLKREIKVVRPSKLNFVKLNLTGIALKNYGLQYERILNRKFSVALGYRFMPSTNIPFKSSVIKAIGENDPETINFLETFKISNYAITPEVRIYLSRKGYGRGFYLAPFYRYSNFSTNNVSIQFNSDNGQKQTVDLAGNLSGSSAGLMLGAQWELGKHLCLDWWILGPHYGSAKGSFTGTTNRELSLKEQYEIKKQIEDIELPIVEKTVTTTSNSANLTISGPWAGVRAGICFGFRF